MHAGNVFAKIVAAFAAGTAKPAGAGAIDGDELTGQKAGDSGADGVDLAGRFGADNQRHLALGERHAAPAPDVDVVQRHRLDAQRDLAASGRRRRRQIDDLELAVLDQLQCAHVGFLSDEDGSFGSRCALRPVPAP